MPFIKLHCHVRSTDWSLRSILVRCRFIVVSNATFTIWMVLLNLRNMKKACAYVNVHMKTCLVVPTLLYLLLFFLSYMLLYSFYQYPWRDLVSHWKSLSKVSYICLSVSSYKGGEWKIWIWYQYSDLLIFQLHISTCINNKQRRIGLIHFMSHLNLVKTKPENERQKYSAKAGQAFMIRGDSSGELLKSLSGSKH